MKYMLLVIGDEAPWVNAGEEERARTYAAWDEYTRMLVERGANPSGEELAYSASATVVRKDGGRFLITDGPFAESVEQISGYMMVEAKDLDEAIEFATAMPADCEIRPVMEL
ncbi:YciI family protein [Nonomuraea sp. NPDC050556]|uniref:YciI family protein n=1 Tax=Nonomuraea sp. NPDC050556 TaxID=3364369 RepID=UPI00378A0CB3